MVNCFGAPLHIGPVTFANLGVTLKVAAAGAVVVFNPLNAFILPFPSGVDNPMDVLLLVQL